MQIGLGISLTNARPGSGLPPQPGWSIAASDGGAEIVSAPTTSGSWLIAPGDASAQITAHPEFS